MGIFRQAVTKSAWKKALKKQYVRVNGTTASSATFIRGGETISLSIPEQTGSKKKLILPLNVLWEDEHLAVIHKPAGILVSGNRFKTVANALAQNIKPSSLADATIPQPVHRLDYATTGVLLVGKTSSSIRGLNKMFEAKQIDKIYYAVAIGEMNGSGVITTKIDGKEAQSEYTVEETVLSERFGQLNLVQLTPQTGRRHQLRKHLSTIGNPVLGDKDYSTEGLILNGKG
ncbi:MAG: RluA family pseudouridine synthase, partial [Bacteroidota bacterium]